MKRAYGKLVFLFALNFMATPAEAVEKHWAAQWAQVIVIGEFHPAGGFWWFDGWHEKGKIMVREVLFGKTNGSEISFRSPNDCFAPWWNRWRPQYYMNQFSPRGIWFLRRLGDNIWEPAIGCDSGYRSLSERADIESYIRRYKH